MPKEEDLERERLIEFVHRKRHALLRHARKLVGSPEAAEDLIQDLMVKLLRIESPSSIRNLKHYVNTAILRLALDHFEHESLRRKCMVPESLECRIDELRIDEADPGQIYDCECLMRALKDSAARFPPEVWMAFTLSAEGYTQREIAERLNCSAATVNTMVKKVRQVAVHLSECLLGAESSL